VNFFLSPGFGGLCAVLAAVIAYGAATLATRQKTRNDAQQRRQDDIARVWDRFVWVMEHREEFNPVLTADLLDQLIGSGERLADEDLVALGQRISQELFRDGQDSPTLPPPSTSTTPPDLADTDHDEHEGM
jgi:hypothetical protein